MTDPLTKLVSMEEKDDAAARQRQAILIAVIEALPDGLIVVDLTGKIVLANQTAVLLFGYPYSDLINRSVEDLIPVRLRVAHLAHRRNFNAFRTTEYTRAMGRGAQLMGLREDGEEFPIDIQFRRFTTPDGIYNLALIHPTERPLVSRSLHLEDRPDGGTGG